MYKLLLVDDEAEVLEGMKELIYWEDHGISICGTANDGASAFEKALSLKPDIMIVDIKMPKVTGLELLIKLSQAKINIKSIILSGYEDFSYARQAIDLDVVSYLLKPCRPNEILQSVLKAKGIIEEEKSKETLLKRYENDLKINSLTETSAVTIEDSVNLSRLPKLRTKSQMIKTAIDYIENNYSKDIDLEKVAGLIYITPGYLSQLFKQETGINFLDYLNKYRLEKSKELLMTTFLKTYEIAYRVGYNNEKYFSQMFKKYTGMSPKEFKLRIKN